MIEAWGWLNPRKVEWQNVQKKPPRRTHGICRWSETDRWRESITRKTLKIQTWIEIQIRKAYHGEDQGSPRKEPSIAMSRHVLSLLVIWWGMYAWTLHGSFPFDFPPTSLRKGARFWGFRCSRVRGVLGRISSIPLDLASFGGQNLGYGVLMRCSYYPKVLRKSVERFGRSRVRFGGVDPRTLFIPRA
jgi:hypothetical protein